MSFASGVSGWIEMERATMNNRITTFKWRDVTQYTTVSSTVISLPSGRKKDESTDARLPPAAKKILKGKDVIIKFYVVPPGVVWEL